MRWRRAGVAVTGCLLVVAVRFSVSGARPDDAEGILSRYGTVKSSYVVEPGMPDVVWAEIRFEEKDPVDTPLFREFERAGWVADDDGRHFVRMLRPGDLRGSGVTMEAMGSFSIAAYQRPATSLERAVHWVKSVVGIRE